MGVFIAKQPNGLYCRFSSITDCPTNWNMTEKDYFKLCIEKAIEDAKDILMNHLQPFEMVKESFRPENMTQENFSKFLEETK